MNTNNKSRLAAPWIYLFILLVLLELVVKISKTPTYIFPAPSVVITEIFKKFDVILPHLYVTMEEALTGFVIGNLFAIAFGVVFSLIRPLRQGMYPIVVGLQAVPIVAIAPFITIWFGHGLIGKAIMAALICYFPATVISTDGFSNVNRDAFLFLSSVGASRSTIFWSLHFPSAIPSIVAALQVSVPLATIGAIVAELAGSSTGIGYLILRASYEFQTPMLFAALTVTSIVTVAFFKLVQLVGGRYARQYRFSYVTPLE